MSGRNPQRGAYKGRGGREGRGGGTRGGGRGGGSTGSQRPSFNSDSPQRPSPPTGQMASLTLKEGEGEGEENKVVCNLYAIDVAPGSKAYQYDVNIVKVEANGREKSLAKGADDGQRNLNKRLCSAVIRHVCEKTAHCGLPTNAAIVYDGKAMLYASQKLTVQEARIHLPVNDIDDPLIKHYVKSADHKEFVVSVKPTEMKDGLNQHEVAFDDFEQYKDSGQREESRLVRTLLEMVTSQTAINSGAYSAVSSGKLFRHEAEKFDSPSDAIGLGMEFRCGVDKGVKVIENGGKPKPAVVLDAKLSLFYKAQPLAATLKEIFAKLNDNEDKWQLALDLLEGVRVELTYKPHRSVIIGSWSRYNGKWKPAVECEVRKDATGDVINVPTYFRERYGCVVELAQWPCVISKGSGVQGNIVEAFPIDFCRVLPDQRVSQERKEALMAGGGFLTQKQKDIYRRASIMPPRLRLDKIGWHAKQLGLFDEKNPIFKAFGISIPDVQQRAIVRRRPLPGIKFSSSKPSGGTTIRPDVEKATWQMSRDHRYVRAATIAKWALVYQAGDAKLVAAFKQRLLQACAGKGMKVAEPKLFPLAPGKIKLADAFEECVRHKAQLLMFIDQTENKSHGGLKLLEARHKVVTQQLALEKVYEVVEKNKWQTLANMIHKMNCKVGGLNYWPVVENVGLPYDLGKRETMVIGLDVSHPSTGTLTARDWWFLKEKKKVDTAKMYGMTSLHPSVVGVCGNFSADPFIFAGDYFYQEARREAIDTAVLKDYIKWMLTKWAENRVKEGKPKGESLPKYIVVLRDGLSEGQFEMAEMKELPAIRAAALEVYTSFGIATKPKFMFVIGTKRHAKRFFSVLNNRVENLKPGSVVSSQVTRPDCDERYIQASFALQGTAKTVQYAKLCNEMGMSDDQYEAFLLALCFNHQISNCATSLPEPIYQADELAKRGKDNFETMRTHYNEQIPREEVTGKVLPEAMTEMLGYKGSPLECLRVTA